jgi:hypothetical protein
MNVSKRLAIAAATAVTAVSVMHSVMPDQKSLTPEGRRSAATKQLSDQEERLRKERRRMGVELQDAVRADELRPAEIRKAAADAAARKLIRRVP